MYDVDGNITDLRIEIKNKHVPTKIPCSKNEFTELKKLAEVLSKGWKYVRVDLYYDKQPWFSEMTFWPQSGYLSKQQPVEKLGELLDFDLTTTKPKVIE